MANNFDKISEKQKSEIIEKLNKELSENEFRHSISSLSNLGEFGADENIIKYKIETFIKTGKWIPFRFIFLRFDGYDLSYDIFDNRIEAVKAFRDEIDRLYISINYEDHTIIDNKYTADYIITDDEDYIYRGIVIPFLWDEKYIIAEYNEYDDMFHLYGGLGNDDKIKHKLFEITKDEEYTNEMISYFISSGETIESTDENVHPTYLRLIELL